MFGSILKSEAISLLAAGKFRHLLTAAEGYTVTGRRKIAQEWGQSQSRKAESRYTAA